jgi:hypothetical protein
MTHRTSRLLRGAQFVRERSGRVRERLRPRNLHAPSLDWLNFLIADVRGAPYIIVYLITEQGWNPTTTGLISTISGWLGLAAQAPIGAWLDRTGRKRVVMLWALLGLACAVLVLAWVPGFWPVLVANSIIEVVRAPLSLKPTAQRTPEVSLFRAQLIQPSTVRVAQLRHHVQRPVWANCSARWRACAIPCMIAWASSSAWCCRHWSSRVGECSDTVCTPSQAVRQARISRAAVRRIFRSP